MKRATLLPFLLIHFTSYSQKVFFKSQQSFTEKDLKSFYSSFNIHEGLLLFNANDYKLYAYDIKDGASRWTSSINRKSDIAPFVAGSRVWVTGGYEQTTKVMLLDTGTGNLIRYLPLEIVNTKPFARNGIIYTTGIFEGGSVFAYDLSKDTILWSRFIAHGCSRNPYYMPDRIIANAEGNKWIEYSYDGKFMQSGCEDTADVYRFPSELPCAREFDELTHDGREIKGTLSQKMLESQGDNKAAIFRNDQYTFILQDAHLLVLGDRLKQKSKTNLSLLSENIMPESAYSAILGVDEQNVILIWSNQYIQYDYRKKKALRIIDLTEWEPHQAEVIEDQLWLISKKDGLLYGISTQ